MCLSQSTLFTPASETSLQHMPKEKDHIHLNSIDIKLEEIESNQNAAIIEKNERRSRIDDLLSAEARERKESKHTYNNPEKTGNNRFNLTNCCNCCLRCIKNTITCCSETAACCKMCFSTKCFCGFVVLFSVLLAALYILHRMNVVHFKPLSSIVSPFW